MIMIFTHEVQSMVAKYGKKIKEGNEPEACRMVTNFLYERKELGLTPRYELVLLDVIKDHLEDIDITK